MPLDQLYRHSLALLTDLYQLTMAYGYWKSGTGERRAVFHLFFRKAPFKGGYAIAAGLESVADYLAGFRFDDGDLAYLVELTGNDGKPLFEPGFLDYLRDLRLDCEVHAVPEGTVVFPHEPLLRIRGPLLQCQLVETPLLNLINFQTLIATKAARVSEATQGEAVLEFGLRRAQGIDGSLSASRAAYIGGCAATSNVLAGKLYGIPVKGTHAHSWVMSFDNEVEAFDAYAQAMPNNCVFLVDTYDTLQGVRNAIATGQKLRAGGHEMVGVRLDSGDLAELSIAARKLLDEAGFDQAAIVASNDLDEHLVRDLKAHGALINIWGIGTKLATAYEQPALGGVYKLSAIQDAAGAWQHRLKLSEEPIKVSNPGILQVRRFQDADGIYRGDMLYDELSGEPAGACTLVDLADPAKRLDFGADTAYKDLLVPVLRGTEKLYTPPPLAEVRRRTQQQLGHVDAATKRFSGAESYPVGLEAGLHRLKAELMAKVAV